MQLKRYQWVGLCAGAVLFSGSWLTAYFNNWLVSFLAMIVFGGVLYAAIKVERRSTIADHIRYGATAGLMAGLVARILGFIATKWAFGSLMITPASNYGFVNGYFSNLLNGSLGGTIGALIMSALLGACVAFFEPEQQQRATGKKGGK